MRFEYDVVFQVDARDEEAARDILADALERNLAEVDPVVLWSILDDVSEVDVGEVTGRITNMPMRSLLDVSLIGLDTATSGSTEDIAAAVADQRRETDDEQAERYARQVYEREERRYRERRQSDRDRTDAVGREKGAS
jgi:hypothetical protein